MSRYRTIQVCGDRGIAPGSTKGAAQHLRGIAAGLAKRGHDVTSYTRRDPEGPFPVLTRPLEALDRSAAAGADVIYERYALGHRAGLELARAVGARFVLEVNAPLVDEALAHRPHTVEPHHVETEEALLHDADLVITVSTPLSRWVSARRRGPTVTVPNGFEPAWFAPPDRQAAVPTLVFLGHPKPWHGADRLVDLLIALDALGHKPELLIVGGGPGADAILAKARSTGLTDQVTVTGALRPDQASARLSSATVGLAPYPRQDPFYFCPLKVVDYLAAGLPVVSTSQGDIPTLVGDAGIVVDPVDDHALARAVASLLENPARRATMADAGRRRALRSLTWDHAAARTARAIEALHVLDGPDLADKAPRAMAV